MHLRSISCIHARRVWHASATAKALLRPLPPPGRPRGARPRAECGRPPRHRPAGEARRRPLAHACFRAILLGSAAARLAIGLPERLAVCFCVGGCSDQQPGMSHPWPPHPLQTARPNSMAHGINPPPSTTTLINHKRHPGLHPVSQIPHQHRNRRKAARVLRVAARDRGRIVCHVCIKRN